MSFLADTPTPQPALDTFDIKQLTIVKVFNEPTLTSVRVIWYQGYMDTGDFVPVNCFQEELEGADLLTTMGALADGTKSLYDNVKAAVWSLLSSRGLIPAGTVQ